MRRSNILTAVCFLLLIVLISASLSVNTLALAKRVDYIRFTFITGEDYAHLMFDVYEDNNGIPMVSLNDFLCELSELISARGYVWIGKYSLNSYQIEKGLKDKLKSLSTKGSNMLGVSEGDTKLTIFGKVYELDSPVKYLDITNNYTTLCVPLSWCLSLFDDLPVEIEKKEGQTIYEFYGNMSEYEYIVKWLADTAVPERRVNTALYEKFLKQLTLDLTSGASTDMEKLEIVYDFILENFCYTGKRDGAAIDGTRRPNPSKIPRPDGIIGSDDTMLFAFAMDEDFYLRYSWELLYTGQGSCTQFSALFGSMAEFLGFNVWYAGGEYINNNGSRVGHQWTAIKLDGNWYFFDPQIETSNVTKNPGTKNRRIWWMQNVHNAVTQSRYDTDFASYGVVQNKNQTNTSNTDTEIAGSKDTIRIVVNGEPVSIIHPQPTMKNGRIFVPLGSVFKQLGFITNWKSDTSTAVLKNRSDTVKIPVGKNSFTVNGKIITPDVPAYMINMVTGETITPDVPNYTTIGLSMYPLEAICDGLGAKFNWDAVTRTVSIEYKIPGA